MELLCNVCDDVTTCECVRRAARDHPANVAIISTAIATFALSISNSLKKNKDQYKTLYARVLCGRVVQQ